MQFANGNVDLIGSEGEPVAINTTITANYICYQRSESDTAKMSLTYTSSTPSTYLREAES